MFLYKMWNDIDESYYNRQRHEECWLTVRLWGEMLHVRPWLSFVFRNTFIVKNPQQVLHVNKLPVRLQVS